jgi:hypothetical protein
MAEPETIASSTSRRACALACCQFILLCWPQSPCVRA